jgi:hypothetical protein
MFKPNDEHNQEAFFESTFWMDPKTLSKLDKSWAPIFYKHVFKQIDELPFAILYDTIGKPNFPVNILLSLEYIKHMKCCSDLELLDYYNFDYLVNYAVGQRTLGERGLSERTLYYFRERVYNYSLENPGQDDFLFGQFIKLVREFSQAAGISMDEQRTDTTLFMSNIKKAGRMSLAYDVLVKGVKAIPKEMLTDALSQALGPGFKTDVLYHSKAQEGDSKLAMLLNLCREALVILEALEGKPEPEEVRMLRRFINEQSVVDAETEKLTTKPNKDISSDSLQSAYDEDATYRKKGNIGQSGYVLEITETCGKDNTFQIITDYAVEPNNTGDASILSGRLEGISENTGCTDMYADGTYHSDDVYNTAGEYGINIHLTNMTGTGPSKKISVTEFDIDEDTNIINKCPGGHTPTSAGVSRGQTSAHFPHEACANCEFRGQCYSKTQVKDNVVRINLKTIEASRQRESIKADKKENTSMRAGIEGSNSALKRKGQRKLAVRGIAKSTVVSGLKVAAQNIKRFIKYMQGGYKPKPIKMPSSGIPVPIAG